MSYGQQFVITVRFPEWSQDDFEDPQKVHKYPPFGVKYLFTMGIIPLPEWEEDDKRWFSYSEERIVADEFKKAYKAKIKQEFDGDILFIEPSQYVSIKAVEETEL